MEILKTALYDDHVRLGARMVEFAGWLMPVQYRGVIEEHRSVRTHVGIFDVSHMGEVFVEGPNSLTTLQWLTTNDVSKLRDGEAQYSLLTNERGGIVDDVIIYCLNPGQRYMVCVNAANTEKDFNWMLANNRGAIIRNESSLWGQIAVQGPSAIQLGAEILGPSLRDLKPFTFSSPMFQGTAVIVARTGYTGEEGFEIFVPNEKTSSLWNQLLSLGEPYQVSPIGLGARDSLRTEMKYSLYGHEITDDTNPLEARLGWAVKFQKGDFMGRSQLQDFKENGTHRELVGFKMRDKGIPREGYSLFSFDKRKIGTVTSGTMSPSLGEAIGIGYVERPWVGVGSEIFVDIRGRHAQAEVVKTPFVRKN